MNVSWNVYWLIVFITPLRRFRCAVLQPYRDRGMGTVFESLDCEFDPKRISVVRRRALAQKPF